MSEPRHFEVLVTAAEAYPRLEELFLQAKQEILAGFRIFDPWTKLRSEAARQCGDVWFDLIVDTLNRGVRLQIVLTDFDPVVRMDMHLYAWQCLRALVAAAEASSNPHLLDARVAMHPARLGMLPRTALWLRSAKEISTQVTRIMQDKGISPDELLEHAPRVRDLVKHQGDRLRTRYFPPPPLVPVTHHQKLAVFDGARLYIGGLDLNDRRFDTPAHRQDASQTWHDVQVLVDGPIAREARTHLKEMEDGFDGRQTHRPDKLLRTISAKRRFALPFMSPKPMVQEIADAHYAEIHRAEELIYFETQFFREESIARRLARRAREAPNLTLLMMLPAAPEDIAFTDTWGPDAAFGEHLQARCLDIVFDAFAERAFVGAPVQRRTRISSDRDTHYDAPIIYLHAKVSIFDEASAIVSSANLNGRSLRWDTEAGVQTETAAEVAQVKNRCFRHWLGDDADETFYKTGSACDAWAARASLNARKRPEDRLGFVVPYSVERGREDAQALPGVPAEMA